MWCIGVGIPLLLGGNLFFFLLLLLFLNFLWDGSRILILYTRFLDLSFGGAGQAGGRGREHQNPKRATLQKYIDLRSKMVDGSLSKQRGGFWLA